ncbi:hypothetical protein U1769_00855 [Sphingomonas sp. ZT3P38]|uniref:hypothetical protein n=1 Tax=Parasphingomonas zepuensis TaxID=3096161 RepID=UPI002FCB0151
MPDEGYFRAHGSSVGRKAAGRQTTRPIGSGVSQCARRALVPGFAPVRRYAGQIAIQIETTGIDAHSAEIPAETLPPQLLVEEMAPVFELPGWSVAGWPDPPPPFALSLSKGRPSCSVMANANSRARFFHLPLPRRRPGSSWGTIMAKGSVLFGSTLEERAGERFGRLSLEHKIAKAQIDFAACAYVPRGLIHRRSLFQGVPLGGTRKAAIRIAGVQVPKWRACTVEIDVEA